MNCYYAPGMRPNTVPFLQMLQLASPGFVTNEYLLLHLPRKGIALHFTAANARINGYDVHSVKSHAGRKNIGYRIVR